MSLQNRVVWEILVAYVRPHNRTSEKVCLLCLVNFCLKSNYRTTQPFSLAALTAFLWATLYNIRSCTTNQLQVSNFKINQTIFQRHSCVMAHEKRIQDKHNRIFGVNNIKESVFVSFILPFGKLFTRKESIYRRRGIALFAVKVQRL